MVVLTFLLSCAALSFLPAIYASTEHHVNRQFEHHHRSVNTSVVYDHDKRQGNIGRYDFFVPGFSVPLISTSAVNGKIYLMDKKYDPGNTTGAYELDPSLVTNPDWTTAWRALNVQDEIFCSASIVLPDKAGRILNVAGWSDAALYGVRLFWPDGAQGVPSVNNWQEDENNAALQRPRWYASAVMLANGSILVMGGTDTNSGNAQPNLEILPRIPGGDTTVYLQFLADTHPFNLYPFLIVLNSGNLFVGYYNQARILDHVTMNTVTVLPGIPSGDGGRTYPYSGTAMLLPVKAPWTAPSTVMVCGGATAEKVGIDTCVSIQPEVGNPQWVTETMPTGRVMSCIVPLADGTYLILNGAFFGVSGFASAWDPNFTPVLYDPTQAVGNRMTQMASTNIARLYHSEASLMLDGSVVVSGSDPQDPNYPQEYRIERFSPPYLLNGLHRPGFSLATHDWVYAGGYQIFLKGTASTNMKIILVGATSSTHGNTMATRTLVPALKCIGFGCTVYAPTSAAVCPPGWFMLFVLDGPTPSIAQWIRIGGDPAQLGNWPPGPVFSRPGV